MGTNTKLKHILNIQDYRLLDNVNEHIQNPKRINAIIREYKNKFEAIRNGIEVNILGTDVIIFNVTYSTEINSKVRSIIDQFKNELHRSGYDFPYKIVTDTDNNKFTLSSTISQHKMLRVKPTHFVYHVTLTKNVGKILKEGLLVSESYWSNSGNMNYLYDHVIYVSQEGSVFPLGDKDTTLLKIDTTKINNKFWLDVNLHNPRTTKADSIKYIMTFEDIPPDAITIE